MKPKVKVLLLLIFTLLSGCAWGLNPPTPVPGIDPTETIKPFTSPVPTITGVPTLSLTVAPDMTHLPALSQADAKEVLALFVKNNGGCKLPCLMGLMPGENYQSVRAFGAYFNKYSVGTEDQIDSIEISGSFDNISGGAWLTFWENRIRVDVNLNAHIFPGKEQIEYIHLLGGVYKHFDDRAQLLRQDPYYDSLLGIFSLSNILTEYGEPTEIWIMPFPLDLGYSYQSGAYPFDFVLLYKNKGFAIEYTALVKEETEYLTGCPDVDYMQISTWNPEKNKNFTDIAQYFSGTDSLDETNAAYFKPLQDATSFTVKEFYAIYKISGTNQCIKTPKKLWP